MALSNLQLWNYLRKTNPNFESHTAEGTNDLFTEKGFEALKRDDIDAVNDFFSLSLRVAFQKLTASKAKNPLEDSGIVEIYDTPFGGYTQRMAVNSIKPVTPAFKGLVDGQSVDPFIVRKPETDERFFPQNFDFQSFITVQEFQIKTIFINEYGMSDLIAGIMQGLMNGWTLQRYNNILEAIHSALTSTAFSLQTSQQIELSVEEMTASTFNMDDPKALEALTLQLKDIGTQIETSAQTSAFNALGFATAYDTDDFVVLMRAGLKNRIQLALEVGAFNPDRLTVPFAIKEVQNFGGLVPTYNNAEMQSVYDRFGAEVGYIANTYTVDGYAYKSGSNWYVKVTGSDTPVQVTMANDIDWVDPHEDVQAIVCQKGVIFENIQNGLETRPIYNPRGLYQNYWVSSPNNSICYDPLYAMIVISKPSE